MSHIENSFITSCHYFVSKTVLAIENILVQFPFSDASLKDGNNQECQDSLKHRNQQ